LDDLTDRALKIVGELDHVRVALLRGGLFPLSLGGRFVARFLLGAFTNDDDIPGHVADFIAPTGTGNQHVESAAGHPDERIVQAGQTCDDPEDHEQDGGDADR
jgi:hypothetical protein